MADVKKTYQIEINGIKESIDAVESLNKVLNELDSRIKALEKSTVKINTSSTSKTSGNGGSTRTSNGNAVSEEEKLAKQIEQIDAKRVTYSKEIYQNYLAAKDVLKETVNDQKTIAAQERLQANSYTNTMQGLKERLKDIQTLRNVTDMASDEFKELTAEANELVQKLKELEAATGSFGRNVGNYKSAFDGLEKVTVTINGMTQEFNNLRQASRALTNAMGALEANGKKDTKMYKEMERELERVSKAQLRLNSAMNDAKASSKAMDNLLDTFESFTALQQVSQGFSTFFGLDGSEIEKQIAKLVALQNMLEGIEKIRQQMNTGEGIGGWFSKGSKAVDQFVAKLAGADYRMGKIVGTTKSASIALQTFSNVLKGIGGIALTGGLMALTSIIGGLVEQFKKWYTGGIEAGDATKILASDVSTLDNATERLLATNTENYFYGMANESATATNQIEILTAKLLELTGKIQETQIVFEKFSPSVSWSTKNLKTLDDARDKFQQVAKAIEQIETNGKNSVFGETIYEWAVGVNGYKRLLKDLGEVIANDFLARAEEAIQKARNETLRLGYVTKETVQEIKGLEREMNENRSTRGVLDNIEKFCDNSPRIINQLDAVRKGITILSSTLNTVDPAKMTQYIIDGMADSEEKIRKQNELNRKKEMESVGFNPQYTKVINDKYDRELEENLKAYRKSKKQEIDQKKKEERDVQNEIDEYKLQLMREGLAKEQKALELERRQRLKEIADSGIRVAERQALVNQVHNKKLLELNRDWAYEMENVYQEMYDKIFDIQKDGEEKILESQLSNLEMGTNSKKQNAWKGSIDVDNPNNISARNKYYQDLLKIEEDAAKKEEELRKENLKKQLKYNQDEEKLRHDRVADAKTVNLVMQELMKSPNPEDVDYSEMEKNLQGALTEMRGELVDAYNAGKLSFKDFVGFIKQEQVTHNAEMEALLQQYNTESNKNVQDGLDKKTSAYNTYYTNLLSSVRTMQDEVARQMQKTPIKDDAWGVVRISKTKEQYSSAIDAYTNIANDIRNIQQKLKEDLQKGNIKEEDFFMRYNELESMKKSAEDATREVVEKQKMLVSEFIQSIQQYVQAAMNSFTTIMNEIWNAQDVAFDKEQEEIDKINEELEKKLDEQEDLISKHKSTVESLEDELATSRGDRRRELIDQINAEMEAERAAEKEKQKIQKQQEAQQRKQDELEKKRKKAQYKRDQLQAIVNGAMAVTYAAINKWPIPAIPMMALAASTTAAQLAIMAANKPYAKGGQLEGGKAVGNRHRDGGIKVLGGRAEIEGGEFITNRISTEKNIDILEYINNKHKKLDLDDFIDFYSSGKTRRSISSTSPRRVFADGGVIPTMRNDFDINDRLVTAFETYNDRPVVVSVVDINNRQQKVRNVRVLAGLDE